MLFHAILNKVHRAQSLVFCSMILNLVLSIGKMIGGFFAHSQALFADGCESLLDFLGSIFILVALNYAIKPPDKNHPYGYGKAESLGAIAGALFFSIVGIILGFFTINKIANNTNIASPSFWALPFLIAILIIKVIFFYAISQCATQLNSKALLIDSWHHRSDTISSFVACCGITLTFIDKRYILADSYATLISCFIILYTAYFMLTEPLQEIMDAKAPDEAEKKLIEVAASIEGVLSTEKCRIRKSGLFYIADIHIRVNGELSVYQGHLIAHAVKNKLITLKIPIYDITVHIEPQTVNA